jgi:ABC-2 type transport system permease protein
MTSLVSPPDRAARTRRSSPLTGVGTLVRSTLRRDRVRIPVWIGALTVMVLGSAGSSPDVYPTQATRQARAELMSTPAARAIGGPGHGLDDYTYGAMMTEEMLGFAAVFVALMSLLLVVRHTRAEEQAGRAELVRDGVVGRHAPMAAALLIVVAANLTLGGLIAAGLGGLGIDTIDWSGSLLFGAALSAVGITFAGVAAVTAQFSQYSRGASGLAGVALAVAYLLRTAGDMTDGSLSWLSPIGWAQATAAYVDDRWWPLLLNAPRDPAHRTRHRRCAGPWVSRCACSAPPSQAGRWRCWYSVSATGRWSASSKPSSPTTPSCRMRSRWSTAPT